MTKSLAIVYTELRAGAINGVGYHAGFRQRKNHRAEPRSQRRRRAAQGAARDPECRGRRPVARRASRAGAKPLGLSELAAAADLSTAQAHTYLVSLTRLALVKRDAITGNYEPPLSLRLGLMSIERQPAYRAALPRRGSRKRSA